ncbi:MAG: ATP-grasp domain-containing protein [Eubacterium sp.]|nr:ATP-grasp domain-containing protein [Eubacterium sp.]
MFFVVQKEDKLNYNDVEFAIITDLLKAYRGSHEYITMKHEDFYSNEDSFDDFGIKLKKADEMDPRLKKAIPIGEISFVEKFLKIFHGIEFENAIEIPPCLRQMKYLKRKYSIVPVWEIPRKGSYFIKDATRQKIFSYKGDLETFLFDEMFEERTSEFDNSFRFDYEHLYQVSEIVEVLAEYRVYVLGGQVEAITQFAGNSFLFPDVELIKEAVATFNSQPDSPRSYSLDVMITPDGTAITEIHNFMCLGLYNVNWNEKLLYAYKDGWDYVLNKNVPQTEYSNF